MLDEIADLEIDDGGEVIHRLVCLVGRQALLSCVEQRFRQDVALARLVVLFVHGLYELVFCDFSLERFQYGRRPAISQAAFHQCGVLCAGVELG